MDACSHTIKSSGEEDLVSNESQKETALRLSFPDYGFTISQIWKTDGDNAHDDGVFWASRRPRRTCPTDAGTLSTQQTVTSD